MTKAPEPASIQAVQSYLSGETELEATAQILFRLWRDKGWGPWLDLEALPQSMQLRRRALLTRFEELTRRHRSGGLSEGTA